MKKRITKYRIEEDLGEDMQLFGICSHALDYRLCWEINRDLRLKLKRSLAPFSSPLKEGESEHTLFSHQDDLGEVHLVKNKGTASILIPEFKEYDFFLIYQLDTDVDMADVRESLRNISAVLAVYQIDPLDCPSSMKLSSLC